MPKIEADVITTSRDADGKVVVTGHTKTPRYVVVGVRGQPLPWEVTDRDGPVDNFVCRCADDREASRIANALNFMHENGAIYSRSPDGLVLSGLSGGSASHTSKE